MRASRDIGFPHELDCKKAHAIDFQVFIAVLKEEKREGVGRISYICPSALPHRWKLLDVSVCGGPPVYPYQQARAVIHPHACLHNASVS